MTIQIAEVGVSVTVQAQPWADAPTDETLKMSLTTNEKGEN
jgi:hypothetical protein